MSADKLSIAVSDILQDALDKMLHRTADEMVAGLSYDARDVTKQILQDKISEIFNTDPEVREKLRSFVLDLVTSYHVPSASERQKARVW